MIARYEGRGLWIRKVRCLVRGQFCRKALRELAECQVHLLAVKALTDEGFQQLELNRVQARVATDNHRSRLVVRRLSFEVVCESLTPASVEGELGTCVRLLKPTTTEISAPLSGRDLDDRLG